MGVKEVIGLFLSKEKDRGFDRPWINYGSGMLYATNGHILLEVPIELADGWPLECWKDRPVAEPGWKIFCGAENFIPLDLPLLRDVVANTEEPKFYTVPQEENCENCKGKGYITNGLGVNVDCPDCEGIGIMTSENPGEVIPLVIPVPFMGRHYNWHYLKVIGDAIECFGGQWEIAQGKMKVWASYALTATVLRNGKVRIYIMECHA